MSFRETFREIRLLDLVRTWRFCGDRIVGFAGLDFSWLEALIQDPPVPCDRRALRDPHLSWASSSWVQVDGPCLALSWTPVWWFPERGEALAPCLGLGDPQNCG
ncbi:hypothetical protein FQA47_025538 [Oryzias melastigma]|uniref:Uncharacterized protein n=1 Tax=Oryzias melastigma TaxID=30732 RepID=A0A834C5A0_ORYME|nr:hypothetical protein FQA47_025538 [Oryzias melastigma]